MKRILYPLLLLLLTSTVTAQPLPEYADIVTYNLLNFSGNDTDRVEAFRVVFRDRHPDVIVAQEVNDAEGVQLFLDSVLNVVASGYAAAPFHNGPDTDNALFYRTDAAALMAGPWNVGTELRDITRYSFRFSFTGAGDIFHLYSMHLKAGRDEEDEEQRAREARDLRNHLDSLGPGTRFLLLGDLNLYTSSEEAYRILTEGSARSRAYDVIPGGEGDWHNNPDFAWIHTQSTRVRSFGGGATGGLDDRFDFILFSEAMLPYVQESEHGITPYPFGNDGQHFNDSINAGLNENVSLVTAQALHFASDHLPVYTRIGRIETTGVRVAEGNETDAFRVTPLDGTTAELTVTMPRAGQAVIRLYNTAGELVRTILDEELPRGPYPRLWTTEALSPGLYLLSLQTDEGLHTAKVIVE